MLEYKLVSIYTKNGKCILTQYTRDIIHLDAEIKDCIGFILKDKKILLTHEFIIVYGNHDTNIPVLGAI